MLTRHVNTYEPLDAIVMHGNIVDTDIWQFPALVASVNLRHIYI